MTTDTDDAQLPFFPVATPDALADPRGVRALFSPVLEDLAEVVAAVTPSDLERPTPCPAYDVAGLRDHIIGWLDLFGRAFADPARSGPRPDPEQYDATTDPDPAATVRAAAARVDDALAGGVLQGEIVMSQSRMAGPGAAGMVLGEYVIHGWDLARALGRPWSPPDAAVSLAHEFFAGMILPEYRGGEGGFFGAELAIPDDAPALDRLLGFAGRDPGWAPA